MFVFSQLRSSILQNLLLLLPSRFSHVRFCATPQTAAHQGSLSLGFSRQEHWSGLPFPSPMQESEKWKWSRTVSVRLFVIPWTTAYQSPPSMGFSRQEYWSGLPLCSLITASIFPLFLKNTKQSSNACLLLFPTYCSHIKVFSIYITLKKEWYD